MNRSLIPLAPALHSVKNRLQALPKLGKGILNSRRTFRLNLTDYKSAFLHIPKLCGQHFLRYASDSLFPLAEALRSRNQVTEYQHLNNGKRDNGFVRPCTDKR